MKYKEKIAQLVTERKTVICVGLDTDIEKIPAHLKTLDNPILEFNRQIIEATSDIVCSYKPNIAFYESLGSQGWEILKKTVEAVPKSVPVIIDAKRGDIGNTSAMYAKAIFEDLGGDAVTLSPYLGEDSLAPFIEYKDKFSFILCVTSNAGAQDFQFLEVNDRPLYHHVAESVLKWNKNDNLGLVVGAPYPQKIKELRAISGNLPFLIPGVGAQGGDLEAAVRFGSDEGTSLVVVNNARAVLYASDGVDFAEKAREEVQKLNQIVSGLGIY
ncbi:MAG: orotidine-5'-phosphate decarboxylase [Candidatus Zixiibacteriota bacterium]